MDFKDNVRTVAVSSMSSQAVIYKLQNRQQMHLYLFPVLQRHWYWGLIQGVKSVVPW